MASLPASKLAPADLARDLAGWTSGLRYEDLPGKVVAQAKRLLLDTLAVAWAGSSADGVAAVRDVLVSQGGKPEAGVWVHGDRLPATQAALLNGMMGAALDFDSVHDVATVHADVVVLPSVLALAERQRLSGREFLAAYAAGDEMLVRLGLAVTTHPGWFYTSVLGVFAAAAAGARALKLDAERTQSAMGIALSRAAGTQQTLVERSLTKRMQSAFAARDGVEAALFAQAGISAPAALFDGQAGFEKLYTVLDAGRALTGLGRDYLFPALTLKKYASCFCNHAAIEATLELVHRHRLKPADVKEASVRVSPFMARLVGAPFVPGDNPQVAAQFSAQYSVASVLARGRFAVGDILPEAVTEPAVVALAKRVRVEVDAKQDGKFVPATVGVLTMQGASFEATATSLPGTPERPMSDAELREKALACFASGAQPMAAATANRIIDRILAVEDLPDMNQLWT
jgi:2-methylcitrate dehydratase PrpD